jgi:hypothetical protein
VAKSTVRKPKGGFRFKTFKETRRDNTKSRTALKKRTWKKIFKAWGL